MYEIITFIFSSFWVFWGTAILLLIITGGFSKFFKFLGKIIAEAYKQSNKVV